MIMNKAFALATVVGSIWCAVSVTAQDGVTRRANERMLMDKNLAQMCRPKFSDQDRTCKASVASKSGPTCKPVCAQQCEIYGDPYVSPFYDSRLVKIWDWNPNNFPDGKIKSLYKVEDSSADYIRNSDVPNDDYKNFGKGLQIDMHINNNQNKTLTCRDRPGDLFANQAFLNDKIVMDRAECDNNPDLKRTIVRRFHTDKFVTCMKQTKGRGSDCRAGSKYDREKVDVVVEVSCRRTTDKYVEVQGGNCPRNGHHYGLQVLVTASDQLPDDEATRRSDDSTASTVYFANDSGACTDIYREGQYLPNNPGKPGGETVLKDLFGAGRQCRNADCATVCSAWGDPQVMDNLMPKNKRCGTASKGDVGEDREKCAWKMPGAKLRNQEKRLKVLYAMQDKVNVVIEEATLEGCDFATVVSASFMRKKAAKSKSATDTYNACEPDSDVRWMKKTGESLTEQSNIPLLNEELDYLWKKYELDAGIACAAQGVKEGNPKTWKSFEFPPKDDQELHDKKMGGYNLGTAAYFETDGANAQNLVYAFPADLLPVRGSNDDADISRNGQERNGGYMGVDAVGYNRVVDCVARKLSIKDVITGKNAMEVVQLGTVKVNLHCNLNARNKWFFNICVERNNWGTLTPGGTLNEKAGSVKMLSNIENAAAAYGWCASGPLLLSKRALKGKPKTIKRGNKKYFDSDARENFAGIMSQDVLNQDVGNGKGPVMRLNPFTRGLDNREGDRYERSEKKASSLKRFKMSSYFGPTQDTYKYGPLQ